MANSTRRLFLGRHAVPTSILAIALLALTYNPATGARCGLTFTDFTDCILFDASVTLHWRDEGDTVTIAMEADGTWDWIGFGVSEAGGMQGTDMAIVRRNLTGEARWWIGDYWSMAFQMPVLDQDKQDVRLLSAGWSNGTTTAVFRRPLDTCNDQEDKR
jgi:hypothetical protein